MFLYFVQKPFDAAQLRKSLGYAFESDGTAKKRETLAGPNSAGPGMLIAHKSVPDDRFKLELAGGNQTWRKIPGCEATIYCGRWNDVELLPSMVQRDELVEGEPVELADGSSWQVAYARKFIEIEQQVAIYNPLPKALDLDDEGKWVPTRVADRFLRLSELANQYSEAVAAAARDVEENAESVRFEFAAINELAIAGLTANYRVGPTELALYRLWDVPTRNRIVESIMDLRTMIAWQKKRIDAAPDGSGTYVGRTLPMRAG